MCCMSVKGGTPFLDMALVFCNQLTTDFKQKNKHTNKQRKYPISVLSWLQHDILLKSLHKIQLQNMRFTSYLLRPFSFDFTRNGWKNGSFCLTRSTHFRTVHKKKVRRVQSVAEVSLSGERDEAQNIIIYMWKELSLQQFWRTDF